MTRCVLREVMATTPRSPSCLYFSLMIASLLPVAWGGDENEPRGERVTRREREQGGKKRAGNRHRAGLAARVRARIGVRGRGRGRELGRAAVRASESALTSVASPIPISVPSCAGKIWAGARAQRTRPVSERHDRRPGGATPR